LESGTAHGGVFLLLYVDDIVLTASSAGFLHRIIAVLRREFSMTDMGPFTIFWVSVFGAKGTTCFSLSASTCWIFWSAPV
jgi:hypothetical protein